MFGLVTASVSELDQAQKDRYTAVYCGICRAIRGQAGQLCRLALSYDVAFLALLLQSLYEPEETSGPNACLLHPIKKRPWVNNVYIRYAADMNVALAYYKAMDDWEDDGKYSAKFLAGQFGKYLPEIEARYPRQCRAIRSCIEKLNALEAENCANPDEPAGCFGQLMAELLVYKEDLWADDLRQTGFYLGRFIYLLDAALDYEKDRKKGTACGRWSRFPSVRSRPVHLDLRGHGGAGPAGDQLWHGQHPRHVHVHRHRGLYL